MIAFLHKSPAALPATLEVAGRALALDVTRNPRARRLTLRLSRDGAVARVTAPVRVRDSEIAAFVERHRGWLAERLGAVPAADALRPGVKVPILGVPHRIVHQPGRGVSTRSAGADGPELHVFGEAAMAGRRIADLLKKDAKAMIEPMALEMAAQTGKRVKAIRFKDTSSRWGSCSSDGTLAFSWRIMMAPRKVVAYLVAHEVAHLTEMNHGPRFWALCRELCPDTAECRAWLKRNGSKLQAISFRNA